MKIFLVLHLSGWKIWIRFLYANLTSCNQEVIAIPRVSKRFEISLLDRGDGGVVESL